MGKPSQHPPGPVSQQCTYGREQFRRICRPFFRQWTQPQFMKLAEAALQDRVIHSSQITGFSTGTLCDPAPKVLWALGRFNELLGEGSLPGSLRDLWAHRRAMEHEGAALGPAEVFLAFTGGLDLHLPEVLEIPLDQEEEVSKVFGKWLRLQLASAGVDFVVEDRARLERTPSFKALIAGKPISGDQLVTDLPSIAAELHQLPTDLEEVIRSILT